MPLPFAALASDAIYHSRCKVRNFSPMVSELRYKADGHQIPLNACNGSNVKICQQADPAKMGLLPMPITIYRSQLDAHGNFHLQEHQFDRLLRKRAIYDRPSVG